MSVGYSMISRKRLDRLEEETKAYDKLLEDLIDLTGKWHEERDIDQAIADVNELLVEQPFIADLVACQHPNKEWVPGFKGASDEPPTIAGWRCPDCDTFIPHGEKDA